MVTIVIIEDNVYARTGWESTLNLDPEFIVLDSYSSCEDAFKGEALKKANVVLLDIGLPGMNGIEGAGQISSINPNALIIMITIHDDDKSVFGSLQSGAVGYLHKSVLRLIQGT